MKVWKVYLRFENEKLRFEIRFLKFNNLIDYLNYIYKLYILVKLNCF